MMQEIKPTQVRSLDELRNLAVGEVVKVFIGGRASELEVYEGFKEEDGPAFIQQGRINETIRCVSALEEYLIFLPTTGEIGINQYGVRRFEYQPDDPETEKLYKNAKELLEKAGMWRN
ncbi:hypothetical protein J4225_01920 [Candidatus Pacearchaeota archaeon]|nr:hypothetical protein [Candidatus Pacearchaeota archaeon]